MRRKLAFLVILLAIAVFEGRQPAAGTPFCSWNYCLPNPGSDCVCSYGMPFGGQTVNCDGWLADCNLI